MDIHSLDALVRAYIAAIVAEATLPLIRRIEELEGKEGKEAGISEEIRKEIREEIREAVEASVESEVESEVSRQMDNLEIPDSYAIRDMVRDVLRDVTFTVETDI